MTKITLKYGRYTSNPMSIETVKTNGTIPNVITNIERDNSQDGQDILLIQFRAIKAPAYLILTHSTGDARGIHYCEANEKGVNCNHATALATIADTLGFKMTSINMKSSLNDILQYDSGFNEAAAVNANWEFGLLPVLEDEEDEDVPSPSVSSPAPVVNTVVPTTTSGPRNPKKDWKDIQEHLQEQNVNVALIHRIYEFREKISQIPVHDFQTPPVKPNMPYMGEYLQRALMHILRGKHLMLIGDMGSGKDTLINTIGWIFNLPQIIVSANSSDTKESLVAEPSFKNNQSTYEYSELSKTVQQGGLVNLAEANMLLGDTTSVFHSLFDENRVLPTPLGSIPHHEHFLLMATLNVGANYSGTKKLNPAFKDRFAVLRLPQGQDFQSMISRKTGLMDKTALKFLEDVKRAIEEFNYEGRGLDAKTYRGYEDAARFFVDFGFNYDTKNIVIEDYIINKEEDLEDYFELREAVRNAHSSFPISVEEKAYLDSKDDNEN